MRKSIANRSWIYASLIIGLLFLSSEAKAAYLGGDESLWLANSSSIYYNLGNVGIGNSNPSAKLHINGAADIEGLRIITSNYSPFVIRNAADTSDLFRIDQNGNITSLGALQGSNTYWNLNGSDLYASSTAWNVGIGTTDPSSILHVYGGASTSRITLGRAGAPGMVGFMEYPAGVMQIGTAGSDGLNLQTTNATRLSIGASGGITIANGNNFVVNTNTLYVNSASSTVGIGVAATGIYDSVPAKLEAEQSGYVGIAVDSSNNVISDFILAGAGSPKWHLLNRGGNGDRFEIYAGGQGARLTVQQDGNVGIGTTTPGIRLTVVGSGNYSIDAGNFRVGNVAAPVVNLDAANKAYVDSLAVTPLWGGATSSNIWNLNSGNVGVGTTAPGQILEISKSLSGGVGPVVNLVNANSATSTAAEIRFGASSAYASRYSAIQGLNRDGQNIMDLAFITGAGATITEKMRITGYGNVGIGVTNPVQKLHTAGIDGNDNYIQMTNSDTGHAVTDGFTVGVQSNESAIVWQRENNYLAFGTNNGEKLRLSATGGLSLGSAYVSTDSGSGSMIVSGNVGIGTTTPSAKLFVNGTSIFNDVATFTQPVVVGAPVNAGHAATKNYVDSTIANATSSITLWGGTLVGNIWNLNSGNVGIGTTSPGYNLDIASSSNAHLRISGGNTGYTNADVILQANSDTDYRGLGAFLYQMTSQKEWFIGSPYADADSIIIARQTGLAAHNANTAQNANALLKITSSGNVGIGTTTPTEKLEVNGKMKIGSNTVSGENITFDGSTSPSLRVTNQYGYLSLAPLNAGGAHIYTDRNYFFFNKTIVPVGAGFSGYSTENLKFYTGTGGSLAMTIATSTNNVGIGTSTPTAKVSVSGGNIFINDAIITSGTPKAAITKEYLDSSLSGVVQYWKLSGSNLFASSTDWNVGIGIASPRAKLDISGTSEGGRLDSLALSNSGTADNSATAIYMGYQNGGLGFYGARILQRGYPSSTRSADLLFQIHGTTADNADTSWLTPLMIQRITGNIGVGTTAPSGKLDVSAGLASQTAGDLVVDTANTTVYVGKLDSNSGNTTFIFRDRLGNQKLKFFNASAGSFFMGNFNQNYGLKIQSGAVTGIASSATTTARLEVDSGAAAFPAAIFTTGNVGIGVTAPARALQVGAMTLGGSADASANVLASGGVIVGAGTYVSFDPSYAVHSRIRYNTSGTSEAKMEFGGYYGFNFIRRDTTSAMVIKGDTGYVAIGTTTATSTLTVSGGNVTILDSSITSGTPKAAVTKDYLDSALSALGSTDNYWKFTSPDKLYASSTDWKVGIGTTNPGTTLTLGNNKWISAVDGAGTGYANMFRVNAANQIEIGSPLLIGPLELTQDGGALTFIDMPVTAAAAAGTVESYTMKIDGNNLLSLYSTSNGTGGVNNLRVGIGTTNPSSSLHVVGNATISTGLTMGGDVNLGGNNITNINKLTVNTIDPLYRIKGTNYSTYASAIVGGVNEEYVGRVKISRLAGAEYEAVIRLDALKEGSDLWVWRKVVDFSPENVQALITPYGSFARVYYKIDGESLIFRSDRPAEISYRLIGKRHDWRQWPTRSNDQKEKPGFILD